MFREYLKAEDKAVLLYGITPPKLETAQDKLPEIAAKTLARIQDKGLDALVVYDVQDESARTTEERPFPFTGALDPFYFAENYLQDLNIPKIIYRPAGKFTVNELELWLDRLNSFDYYPIFVGIPAPDFKPKTSLKEAYSLWQKHAETSVIGAITIPERHAELKDEQHRMLSKMDDGVSYFISQCVFNVDYAKAMLFDLSDICAQKQQPLPTVIFTLTTCGSAKVLNFMEWLGIHVPLNVKNEFLAAENILEKSIEHCLWVADELIDFCKSRKIPFGFNIESVAIRKDEIEASIYVLDQVREKLTKAGLR